MLMPNYDLTQDEANALMAMEKIKLDAKLWIFPAAGEGIHVPLVSNDNKESFILDVQRGRISLSKATYQNRVHEVVPLVRLDVGGPPHRNPDDEEISCPHIHRYVEGYGLKWAFKELPEEFLDTTNLWETLYDFMRYCNVTDFPLFQRNLLP